MSISDTDEDGREQPVDDYASELNRRYFDGKPEMQALAQEARIALDLGAQAYNLRLEAGLSEEELAQKLGVSPQSISDFELGHCEDNAQEFLARIAQALGKKVPTSVSHVK